jgi:hypothetical protein
MNTFSRIQWTAAIKWAAATAFGWLLAHPFLEKIALEASLWIALVIVTLAAAASFARALKKRHRNDDAHWWRVAANIGWALVLTISLVLCQPGSLAGMLQWPLLRRDLPNSAWWVLASALGAFVALNVNSVVVDVTAYFYFTVQGVSLGLMQWLVLRRHLALAGWWVLASTVGWLVGGLPIVSFVSVWEAISNIMSPHAAVAILHTVPNATGGLLCGIVTGVSVQVLLRKREVFA